MFIHNFLYSLKVLFRNKMLIFWTFAFPIILGTFFNMAFSNIESSEKLQVFDIAIVDDSNFEDIEIYKKVFEEYSDESKENRLFNLFYLSEEDAKEKLENGELTGYLVFDDEPKVVIVKNGINETILKQFTEEISEHSTLVKNLVEKKIDSLTSIDGLNQVADSSFYDSLYSDIEKMITQSKANIIDTSSESLSYTMIEFYTLIAMACLYGGILGLYAINKNLANMSSNGKRVAISPTPKRTLVLSSVLAGYVTQIIGVALLFLYTVFVLKVDYGNHLPFVVLLALVGSLAGLSLGVAIASLFKCGEDTKTGIVISVTMLGCFFSGMMGITMKYIIDVNVPILNLCNPANMITDGFYSLYYYGVGSRFYGDVVSLLMFSSVLILITYGTLRRQKYDSI